MLRAILLLVCILIPVTPGWCSAAKEKPMVGVYYFPGWYRGGGNNTDWSEWRGAVMKGAHPRALCGFADDSSPDLWGYFNTWMTSHGIDFIAFDWYYNDGQEFLSYSLDKGFLGSKPDSGSKFCLHWCNHGGPWWVSKLDQTPPKLEKMIDLACERYFKLPNYLRIDGKPVFMIYDTDTLASFGDVKTALATIRRQAKKHGYSDVLLVSVYSGAGRPEIERRKALGYDAFCAYTYCWMRGPSIAWNSKTFDYKDITSNIVDNVHPFLARVAKEEGIVYWPSTFSGWDDRPRAGLDNALVLLNNKPSEFGRMFASGLKHVNPASPVVMVEAWNEWGEGACIEPSKEHGFGYLSEIAKAVGAKKPDQRLPSAGEISSWSILTPEELKVAKENESKPWPTKPIIYNKLGKSRKAAPVKLPVVIDFAAGGPELGFNDISVEGRDATGLTITTTGGDPIIGINSSLEIPLAQIKRITLEADFTMPANRPMCGSEVYITTALLPDFCPFAAFPLPPAKDGKTSAVTSDFVGWPACGTPITRIRLDPGAESGIKVRLRRLIID